MGLRKGLSLAALSALLILPEMSIAAPRLRLLSSTVGPVSIALGAAGPTQTVEAYTDSGGILNLTLTSSVPWIGATLGIPRGCSTVPAICTPLQFALNTSSLPAGTATGIVTVSDTNAVDAPQTITVTVQMGGGVPSSVDLFVAPGGSNDVSFSTNSQISGSVKTNSGGQWLSLTLDGTGSFRFSFPYHIHVAAPESTPVGTYSGTVTTSASSFSADNKTIPVTMRVTSEPIAQDVPALRFKLAQGGPPVARRIFIPNLGQGTLALQAAAASADSGGKWLAAASFNVGGLIPSGVDVTCDPASLTPGVYHGTVAIPSNAANGATKFAVDLEVVPQSAPMIGFQGVVDNGTFVPGDAVARGDIAAVMGDQFYFKPAVSGPAPPLPTSMDGVKVLVNGVEAPLFYVSYSQINFQIPAGAPLGTALVQVTRDGVAGNTVSVPVAARAPRILRFNIGDYGVIVNQDSTFPMPTGAIPGANTHPAHAGDTLTIYGIGLGPTSPEVLTGNPAPGAEPLARLIETPVVVFGGGIGGTAVVPLFAGLTPTYAGLYQLNVTIPDNVPKGIVNIAVAFSDAVSNSVQLAIQ